MVLQYISLALNVTVIVVCCKSIYTSRRARKDAEKGVAQKLAEGEGYNNPRCMDCGYHHERPNKGLDCHLPAEVSRH